MMTLLEVLLVRIAQGMHSINGSLAMWKVGVESRGLVAPIEFIKPDTLE